ncbi:MAG: photosynthetic reaction center subunit M [Herpetosiphonaceae bacterium]|nr:photosynthetic reaction center subunit M [Herpetosiphonaceae bacterium]
MAVYGRPDWTLHMPGDMRGRFGRPRFVPIFQRVFGAGQFGPIYLGLWGLLSVVCGSVTIFIILFSYLVQVHFNPLLFIREFAALSVDPPSAKYGLSLAPWYQGGNWEVATLFLHGAVLFWLARVWNRARANEIKTTLARAFSAAVFLYLVIYLIRPLLLHAWSEAPGHGLKAHLDWVNDVSVRYGNFYYNPFHMLSIFFLLGSTMLWGMHGATIVAVAPYKGEVELEEIELERSGTHRAQLFWRWVMGFNANAQSIHLWAFWFAVLAVIAGGIGLLLSGPVIPNWFEWAKTAHIVSNGIPNR